MITQPPPAELRALVVDDEAITRGMVVFALLKEGFVCDVATDGEKAKVLLEEGNYDLLVTDLQMPYMDGYALAIDVLGGRTPPSIIVHTAHEDPRSVKDLIVRGVDDIVSKPTDYAVFAAKARGIVARRRIDIPQPNQVDSTPEMSLATPEESLEEEPLESPREPEDEEVERLDIAQEAIEVNSSSNESAKEHSPAPSTPCFVPATRNAPVRAQKVFKITDRPSASTAGRPPAQDTQSLTSRSRSAQRSLAFIIPILMMTIAGVALLTTALVPPPVTRDSRLTFSEISSLAAVRNNVIAEPEHPPSGTPTKLMSQVWAIASEQFAALQTGRTRLVKLALGLLTQERSLAASDAQSHVTAPGNSRAKQWSTSLGQALTTISAGVEDLSKYLQHAIEEQAATDQVKQGEVAQAEQEKRSAPKPGATDLLQSNAELPVAAVRAQLEAEFQADLPTIRIWLTPLLSAGHTQPTPAGQITTASKGPMSLTALQRCGAMSNSEEGLSNLARVMTYANDREKSGFVPFTGGALRKEHRTYVVPASRLLLKYNSLLVEKGMLAE